MTNVVISNKTNNLLKQICTNGQTYDDIIAGLLKTKQRQQELMKNSSDTDNNICDGNGCYSRAECTVQVKVGKGRIISLSLCGTCKTKFEDYSNRHNGSEVVSVDQ
jgi:hypothetical protein